MLKLFAGEEGTGDINTDSPASVRQKMSQRIVELIEAVVVSPTKIRIKWEVSQIVIHSGMKYSVSHFPSSNQKVHSVKSLSKCAQYDLI